MDNKDNQSPETPDEKIARLEAELADAQGIIGEQHQQLEAKQLQGAGQLPVITYQKGYYQVQAAKFHYNDVDYTAADLAANADLVKQLLDSGSGLLVKVDKPKQ